MATVEHAARIAYARPRRLLTRERQFVLLFPALALSWFVGFSAFFWSTVAFFILLSFLARRDAAVPSRFGIWLLFLAWVPLSAAQLEQGGDALVFLQRYFGFAAATVLFVYVFNSSRRVLSDATIVNGLATYWGILVVGGLVAVVFPYVEYATPVQRLLPGELLQNAYVYGSVHVRFADVQSLLGFPVGRPLMFFGATNAWGAMVALLTPFAFAALEGAASLGRRRLLQALLVVSIVPIVVSLNRGTWLALTVALAYVAIRFALRLNLRSLAWFAGLVGLVGALVLSTSLGNLVGERLTQPTASNTSRQTLYDEAIAKTKQSPLIGYGGTRPSDRNPGGPPVGTHSQLLFVAFAHGIPALVLFLGWFGLTLVRSARGLTGPPFWAHVSILVFLVESPYYLLEGHLPIAMIAAALIWRHLASARGREGAPASRLPRPAWAR